MTDKSPCEVEIIAAALDRARAQALLDHGAQEGIPTSSLRSRQQAVNQADRRISQAAYTMLAAEMLAPVLRGADGQHVPGQE